MIGYISEAMKILEKGAITPKAEATMTVFRNLLSNNLHMTEDVTP